MTERARPAETAARPGRPDTEVPDADATLRPAATRPGSRSPARADYHVGAGQARPVPGARWDDLDPREFERFRRLVGASGNRADAALASLSDHQLAEALGVARPAAGPARPAGGVAEPELLAEALLLFGRPEALRWYVPHHEAALQVLRADTVAMNDFFHWPLFRLAEEILARFRARNSEQVIRFELVRTGVPAYSEAAFREVLANALTHRDYAVPGAVHVQWTDERITISSPSGLPAGLRPNALLTTPPCPRNPLLADAFKRAGITRRTGHGISQVFSEQLRYGHAPPSFDRSTAHTVIAELPGGPADLAFARYVVARERLGQPLRRADLQVITALRHGFRLRTTDAAELLATSRSRARAHLIGMLHAGLLEVHGGSSARTWHLTAQVHRELREHAAHLRAQDAGHGRGEAPAADDDRSGHGNRTRRTATRTGPSPVPSAAGRSGRAGPAVAAAPDITAVVARPIPATHVEPSGWAIPDGGPALPPGRRVAGG